MFPCVWLHFKKFSGKYFLVFGKEEGKHKSRKTQATTQKKIINDDKSSLMTTPSIAISPSSRDRDLVKCRSRSRIFLFRLHTRSYNRRFARSRRRSRSRSFARSRSTLREIAIDGTISRSIDRDLGSQSSDWSSQDQCRLELGVRR